MFRNMILMYVAIAAASPLNKISHFKQNIRPSSETEVTSNFGIYVERNMYEDFESSNNPSLHRNKIEEDEYKNLTRKWNILTNESETSHLVASLPDAWLQPAKLYNSTSNFSFPNNDQLVKIIGLIQKHENQNMYQGEGKLKSKQMPMSRLVAGNLITKISGLQEKLKNIKNVEHGPNKNATASTENDDGYYPGGNKTARSNLFQEWETYYQCLQENVNSTPKAHYVFPGETIKFNCITCLRPGSQTRIKWKMATNRTKNMEEGVDNSGKTSAFHGNKRIVVRDGGLSLHIYAIDERDAGNYSCQQFKTLLTVHLLQVAGFTENITKVWPPAIKGKPHSTPDISLPNFGLTVFTNWRNWTNCSRCGRVGKRFRIGVCTVRAAINTTNAPKVLTLFNEGIPCRSGLLPKFVREHPNVVSRRSEIMEAFCKETCPQIGKFVIHNEKGEIVEEADNAKGVYSTFQKLPKLPPLVQRKIMFLKQWDTAHIQCPGSLLIDVPTRWFMNEQPIYAKGDRIYVTPSHILVVEDLGLADSNLYSCWQGSKLVGTVRLSVSQPIRLSFGQQISSISMVLILLTIIIIFGRAFCNSFKPINQ